VPTRLTYVFTLSDGVATAMRTIETTIDIHATPEVVWQTLADFDSYTEWNPFLTEAAGSATVGERLEWLGRLGLRGLFDGRHEFRLEGTEDGRTRLSQRERFSGLLVGLLLDEGAIERGFEAMNEALRQRVEQQAVDPGAGTELLAA